MNKKIIFFFIIFLTTIVANSQIDDPRVFRRDLTFQDELTFGGKLSTNGWGLDIRRGYFVDLRHKYFFEGGFNVIHHPKEYKISSVYFLFRNFVYGKINECYDMKLGYGRQLTLYQKKDLGSIEIRLIASTGADIAMLKPIYYIVVNNNIEQTSKFDVAMQPATIERKAKFSKGLNETKLNPGIYLKLGTSFEHSKTEKALSILEFGIEGYYFFYTLDIMAEVENTRLITSLFLSYRFGSLRENHHKKNDLDL